MYNIFMENYFATYAIDIAALMFLALLIRSNIQDRSRKLPFYVGIGLTVLIIFAEAGTIIAGPDHADIRLLNIVCNVVGFSLTPLIPLTLIAIFDMKFLMKAKFLLMPSLVNIIASVLSPWLGSIFYVDSGNQYMRGSLFYLFIISYGMNIVVLIVGTMVSGQRHHYSIKTWVTALALFTAAGTSIQIVFPSVYSSWHCVTLSLILYYLLVSDYDSSLDTLTRLHNRAAFEKRSESISKVRAYSVIVMDIDDFKVINDTYGHDFGDVVLKTIASVILRSFEKKCICYRVGGDEFYIISRETDPHVLDDELSAMISDLAGERVLEARLPTLSYGYSTYTGDPLRSFNEVLKEADTKMYEMKRKN